MEGCHLRSTVDTEHALYTGSTKTYSIKYTPAPVLANYITTGTRTSVVIVLWLVLTRCDDTNPCAVAMSPLFYWDRYQTSQLCNESQTTEYSTPYKHVHEHRNTR